MSVLVWCFRAFLHVMVCLHVCAAKHVHKFVSVRVPAHESVCVHERVWNTGLRVKLIAEMTAKSRYCTHPQPPSLQCCPAFYILNPLQPIQDEIGCRTCVKYEHWEIRSRKNIFKVEIKLCVK